MSQVDYEQKIQEINKLKISDAEKSRRIRVLVLQRKQADEDKVKTAKEDVNKPITMKATVGAVSKPIAMKAIVGAVSKPITMKVTANNNPIVRLVETPVNNDSFREQLHAIQRDESLNNEEKQAKIQALYEIKPKTNVAVQESIERIRQIHAIRKQNLNPEEKMNKIQALVKKGNVRVVVQQRSMDPIKEKISAIHKENISLEEKKLKIQALMKERHA
jgi:lipase chaperone LimK